MNNTKPHWTAYVVAYLVAALNAIVAAWLLVLLRNLLLTALTTFYVNDIVTRSWEVRALDRVYGILAGMAWLSFTILTEWFYRRGVQRHRFLEYVMRISGWEFLLLFAIEVGMLAFQRFSGVGWLRWLIIAVEGIGGLAMALFARARARVHKQARMPQSQ